MILSLGAAIKAGINQGLITCLFSLQSILLAFFARLVFNEKVKWFHYAGIILMFGCASCISLGKQHKNTLIVNGEEIETIHPASAIIIGMVTSVLFALTAIWVRVSKVKGGIHPSNLTMASNFIVSSIMAIIAFATLPIEEFGKEIFF